MSLRIIILITIAMGCNTMPEPCSRAALAQIELQYHAELAKKCGIAGSVPAESDFAPENIDFYNCPTKPEIDAKYRRKREEWVACQ